MRPLAVTSPLGASDPPGSGALPRDRGSGVRGVTPLSTAPPEAPIDLPFDLSAVPLKYPPPTQLSLWIVPLES